VPTYLQHPNLYPCMIWSRLICGISAPFDLPALLALLPRGSPLSARRDASCLSSDANARVVSQGSTWATNVAKRLGITGRSTALVCWTGAMAGSMAGSLRDARLMCDVAQVYAAVTRSRAAGTCCYRGGRPSQDAHVGWLPARAQLAEPSSRTSCTWCIRPPMTLMPTGTLMARAASHDES
jgi:hypothetical protein